MEENTENSSLENAEKEKREKKLRFSAVTAGAGLLMVVYVFAAFIKEDGLHNLKYIEFMAFCNWEEIPYLHIPYFVVLMAGFALAIWGALSYIKTGFIK